MAQPFYARKIDLKVGPRKGETVYAAQAYYYGTIETKQVATQIAQESALSPADVFGVIERLAYYCMTHMALGYKIKLNGMGVLYNELLTTNSVTSENEVTRSSTARSATPSCPKKSNWLKSISRRLPARQQPMGPKRMRKDRQVVSKVP